MRLALVLLVVAACKKDEPPQPTVTCEQLVEHLFTVLGQPGANRAAEVDFCKKGGYGPDAANCLMAAKTKDEITACKPKAAGSGSGS